VRTHMQLRQKPLFVAKIGARPLPKRLEPVRLKRLIDPTPVDHCVGDPVAHDESILWGASCARTRRHGQRAAVGFGRNIRALNVYNDPDDRNPKNDFTLTVIPSTDLWLRMGPTWFTGFLKEEIVWYQKYANERAANDTYSLGWKVPLNRLVFGVSGAYRNLKERPGFEIDARVQRKEIQYDGSAEFRGLSKTFFGVKASRSSENYSNDAEFLGSNLQNELNRVSTTTTVPGCTFCMSQKMDGMR